MNSVDWLSIRNFRLVAPLRVAGGGSKFRHHAPNQVRVVTFDDDHGLMDYAQSIVNELRAAMVRMDADFSATPLKTRIADAEQAKVHTMLVISGRDMEAGNVSVRLHGKGNLGAKPKGEVIAEILRAIRERSS